MSPWRSVLAVAVSSISRLMLTSTPLLFLETQALFLLIDAALVLAASAIFHLLGEPTKTKSSKKTLFHSSLVMAAFTTAS